MIFIFDKKRSFELLELEKNIRNKENHFLRRDLDDVAKKLKNKFD